MTRIKIELTDAQKHYIRTESGVEVEALNVETLEDRDAPKRGSGLAHRVYPDLKNGPQAGDEVPILNDPNLT